MFNFNFDKKIIYIIVGVMILEKLYEYATVEGALLSLLLAIPGVLIATTFHEFAHAFATDKLGDDTARREGRLTLNPLAHLDPVGSFLLLFAGFGWGKPVHVNPLKYTRKISMEKGEALVSIAGPVMNFILAIIFTIITCITLNQTGSTIEFIGDKIYIMSLSETTHIIIQLLISTVSINVGAGIFNLIPLPPLDGSKVIMLFLPYNVRQFFIRNESVFYIIFVILWLTGVAGIIISPVVFAIYKKLFQLGFLILGL